MASVKFVTKYGLDLNGQYAINGIWNGTQIGIAYGGTNATTKTVAFDNLSPTTTSGDIIYFNGTNNVRLAKGTDGQILSLASGLPSWSAAPQTGVTAAVGTTNQVLVNGGTTSQTGSVTFSLPQSIATTSTPTFASLTISNTPSNASDAVRKDYVDGLVSGLHIHDSVATATTATLATSSGGTITYSNGTSGVGATLTTTGSFNTIGGFTTTNADRILVKNEATAANNGFYTRTSSTVLTRATDFDQAAEMNGGDFVWVYGNGATLENTGWVCTDPVATVGTTDINFTQFSAANANANTVTVVDDTSTNSFIYPTLTSSTSGAATIKTSSSRIAVNTSNGQLKLNNVATTYAASVSVDASGGSATTIDTFTGSGAKYLLHCYQYYNGLGGAEARSTVELLVNVTGLSGSYAIEISEYGLSNAIVTYNASVNSSTGQVSVTAIGLNASPNVYTVAFQRVAFGLLTNS
jgi:hypothetical protein